MKPNLILLVALGGLAPSCSPEPGTAPPIHTADPVLQPSPSTPRMLVVSSSPPVARDPTPPSTSAPSSSQDPGWLVVAAPSGDLCVLHPHSGSVIDKKSATAIDVLAASSDEPAVATTEWLSDGDGQLVHYSVFQGRLQELTSRELSVPDARLIYAGDFDLALALDMGTTLFVSNEVGSFGRACMTPASAPVRASSTGVDVFLLEAASQKPRIVRLHTSSSTITEALRTESTFIAAPCGARLVDTGSELLLAAVVGSDVIVVSPDGALRGQATHSVDPNACAEDAVWVAQEEAVAVLTGPVPTIHLIGTGANPSAASVTFAGNLWHDHRLRHRLVYDEQRRRLFAAISDATVAADLDPGLTLLEAWSFVGGCKSESVAWVRDH